LVSCCVWITPQARQYCDGLLRESLADAQVEPLLLGSEPAAGPATLLMHTDDLVGPHREDLIRLAERAKPGRPIVIGHANQKDVMLDAINVWEAVQFIAPEMLSYSLADAVREAHHAIRIELQVCKKIGQLTKECQHLQSVTQELRVTHKRLVHTERMATLGRIVGTVLERMRQQVDYLENLKRAQQEVPPSGTLVDVFEAAVAGVDSFGALLEDLLALTEHREARNERSVMSLDDLARRAMRLFRHDSLARRRELEVNCGSDATVRVDSCRVIHVLLNLLRNAAQATSVNGRVALRTWRDGDFGAIEVEDNGCGMTPETLSNLFTPFFTTKGNEGMGLGLRLAKSMVETHGGTIQCQSTHGKGTRFEIRLPIVEHAAAEEPQSTASQYASAVSR
jgi:signal transduction histidine kinase